MKNIGAGTIYLYAWAGGDGRSGIEQGVFALDLERMTWTKVAGQSDSTAYDTYFRVSPDGRFLAFQRWARKGDNDAEVVGISIRDLTRDGAIRSLSTVRGNPFWSRDGRRLIVSVWKGDVPGTHMGNYETWTVNADGTEPRQLVIPESEQVDDESPDGSWLLTCSHRDKGVGYQIYRMRPDGTDARRLTTTGKGVLNLDGRISPDGRRISYWRIGDRESGVWVMDADGTNPRRVFQATPGAIPGAPSWSPDGRAIAFTVHAERRQPEGHLEMTDHKLIVLGISGGAPETVAPPLTSGLGNPQWARSRRS
jgi:Tol biopolymer transport system component